LFLVVIESLNATTKTAVHNGAFQFSRNSTS
jgi:hypothetical protein